MTQINKLWGEVHPRMKTRSHRRDYNQISKSRDKRYFPSGGVSYPAVLGGLALIFQMMVVMEALHV